MRATVTLPVEEVRRLFAYDPSDGLLSWRVAVATNVPAGSIVRRRRVQYGGRTYLCHRLAFVLMCGRWPSGPVRFIDGDEENMRWGNLAESSVAELVASRRPNRFSATGRKGVAVFRDRFQAEITVRGVRHFLGTFDTVDQAAAAYNTAAARLRGNVGRLS